MDGAAKNDGAEALRALLQALDAIATIVFITGKDRRLEFVNARYAEFRGAPREEVVQQNWEDSVHPEDLPAVREALRVSAENGTSMSVEQRVRRHDGAYRWLLVQSNPMRGPSGEVERWFGTATDIDDSKRAQAQVDALLEGAPIGVSLLDRDLRYLRINRALADINGIPRETHLGKRLPELLPEVGRRLEPIFASIFRTGEPVLGLEISGRTPRDPDSIRQWVASYFPVRVENEIVGVASLVSETTAQKRTEWALRTLARVGAALTRTLDLHSTVDGAVRLLVPEVANAVLVCLADDGVLTDEVFVANDDLALEAALGDTWRRSPPNRENLLLRVLETKTPELIDVDDVLLDRIARSPEHRAVLASLALRSMLVVPLLAHGRVLGGMVLGTKTRRYDDADLDLGVELGRRIGAAVENARLFAVAEQRGAQLERLQSFSAALAAVRTLSEVAEVIVYRGRRAFVARSAVFCMLADDGHALEIIRDEGYDEEAVEPWRKMPLDAGVPLTDAVVSAKPLFFNDNRALAERYPAFAQRRLAHDNALLVLPLITRTQPIGALALEMDGPRDFNPEVQADLMAFGWLCAQAIERAVLFDVAETTRARAEEANRAKDEFLAVLSHEIRTPLNAIMGWAKMLMTGALDEAQTHKAIATIERNARVQAQLVEDLLDVSRIITGKLKINVEEVSLVRVIEGAVDVVRPAATAKGVKLEVQLDERVDLLLGDAARLQQVVWNLLSNAVKFSERGGRVALRTELAGTACRLTVTDSGQGIPSEFLPHVFERFRQVDMGTARAHGGLGLGLAIVRHLVEMHGGEVAAFSEGVGKGARFIVTLPLSPLLRSTPPSVRPPEPRRSFDALDCADDVSGLRVLVVDDEADARDLLKSVLTHCGAVVYVADEAATAMTTLSRERPDVIVSDIGMPGDDGYAFLRSLRALPPDAGGRTPAVALTAYARLEDRARAMAAGFDAHLAKPIDPAELVSVVAYVAGRAVTA